MERSRDPYAKFSALMGRSHLVRISGSHAIVILMAETMADRNAEANIIMQLVKDEEPFFVAQFHTKEQALNHYRQYLLEVIYKSLEIMDEAQLQDMKDWVLE